jgi:hypothetical protein
MLHIIQLVQGESGQWQETRYVIPVVKHKFVLYAFDDFCKDDNTPFSQKNLSTFLDPGEKRFLPVRPAKRRLETNWNFLARIENRFDI